MKPGGDQSSHILEFVEKRGFPVHFLFYKPPRPPLKIAVPIMKQKKVRVAPRLGARVTAAPGLIKELAAIGKPPTFGLVDFLLDKSDASLHPAGGDWSIL